MIVVLAGGADAARAGRTAVAGLSGVTTEAIGWPRI
jgi:hypothetical protein